jgi:hypothetical protein
VGLLIAESALTADQIELLRSALTIPGCWSPILREKALAVLDEMEQQLSLLEEPA